MTGSLSAAFAALRRRAIIPAITGAVLALTACAAPAPSPNAADDRGSLLWQVEKDGYARSYVLGTIHSTDPRLRTLPREVHRALDASAVTAFEVLPSAEGAALLKHATVQPEGRRLEDVLGSQLFKRTAAAVRGFGVTAHNLQRMTTLAIIGMLTYPQEELRRIARGEPILDVWLQQEALRRGKTLRGLESYDEQISIFTDMSDAEQVVLVSDMLADNAAGLYDRLLKAYLAGDIATIEAEAMDWSNVSDFQAAERFNKRLFDNRNLVMVERVLPLMEKDATFVAVGAGHLPGEAGILHLLKQRGFTVTRLH